MTENPGRSGAVPAVRGATRRTWHRIELATPQEAILEHARAAAPREACGLLVRDARGGPLRAVRLTNVASRPEREFELDPAALCAWLTDPRQEVAGVWHSHPRGGAEMSARDRAAAEACWLQVVAGRTSDGRWVVRAYRSEIG